MITEIDATRNNLVATKGVIIFVRDGLKWRALDSVYDSKTGLTSLLVSRAHGKTTFPEEYTAAQTNTVIITPAAGKRLDIVGVLIHTDATTGVVSLDFATSGIKVMRLYASAFSRAISDDMHIAGAVDEVLTLNTTTGANNVFIHVNYRET